MHVLVVGQGSIGKRHAQVLTSLACKVSVVSAQTDLPYPCFASIEAALAKQTFDHVIIANATHLHYPSLCALIHCHYDGVVLVEKPLYANMEDLPPHSFKHILLAYNLRFHELLLKAKQLLAGEKLLTFSAYVGQYLPTWRAGRDYRTCYSAKKADGGGVLRDLSHELDYALWFCGKAKDVAAIGGRFSELEIDSDDVCSILMKCEQCPMVSLHLNYLDKVTRREIVINTEKHTLAVDLVKGELRVDGEVCLSVKEGGVQTYTKQHQALIHQVYTGFCDYRQGLDVMKLIGAIERASQQAWGNL